MFCNGVVVIEFCSSTFECGSFFDSKFWIFSIIMVRTMMNCSINAQSFSLFFKEKTKLMATFEF